WCRRNPVVAGLLALVALLLLSGTVVSALFALDAAEQARVAREKAKDAETERRNADKERRNAQESARLASAAESRATEKARLARQSAYDSGMLLTQAAWEQHQVDRFLQLLEDHRPRKVGDEDFRGFEWFYWKRQFQRGHVTLKLKRHSGPVNSLSFSADGKRLAAGSWGEVTVWDAQTGQEPPILKGQPGGVRSVAFSPDGKRLASASEDRTVKVWNAQTGQEQLTLKGHTNGVFSVAFSDDGKRILSASDDQTVKVWD